jgi:hypothetical protein
MAAKEHKKTWDSNRSIRTIFRGLLIAILFACAAIDIWNLWPGLNAMLFPVTIILTVNLSFYFAEKRNRVVSADTALLKRRN